MVDLSRKLMIISVTILGISIGCVMFAYIAFGDNTEDDVRTLRATFIIFRHGSKYPDKPYSKDFLTIDVQTHDPGSLTGAGSLQMYNLGKNLRHRYLKLLPKNGFYSKKVIQVKASWMDRTIASALAFLAGFMPPLENTNPLPIQWQPVPVVSIPRDRDDIIAQKRFCSKYDQVYSSRINSDEIKKLNEENRNLYRILSQHTGENISTLLDVETIHNTLEAEKSAGWTLPDWTEDIFPDKTLPLAERYLKLLTDTAFMKRIKGGPLITEIIDGMVSKKSLLTERTITIFSGHDVTLVNLMNAMGIIDQTSYKPDFSSALAIELHHSLDHIDDMDVKVYFYYNHEDKYPKNVKIEGCQEPCALSRFRKVMNGLIVNDFEKLCEIA